MQKIEKKRLTIYIAETDRYHGRPLHEAIIYQAKEMGLSGACAIKGFMSFGHYNTIHTSSILVMNDNLPIIIEIIESLEKIENFLSVLQNMESDNLITLEDVQVISFEK